MQQDNQNLPILAYDGDCGICIEWVNYWRELTRDTINYQPYQDIINNYPEISEEEFSQSIQLIEPGGHRVSGAEAAFSLYINVYPQRLLLWFYKNLPGFAVISELFYNFFSAHRGLLALITHICWGKNHLPSHFSVITSVFYRLLGLVYLSAFLSFAVQARGLIGSDGILPLAGFLQGAHDQLGSGAYYRFPTLFWLYLNDSFLEFVCICGAVFSMFLISGCYTRISLLILYILYLSLFYAGQTFMSFQWDILLLEAGFLALLLPTGKRVVIWLYRWLVFRFMFMGGVVKLMSGDPTWDNLTALLYHFETQPLPTSLAWYMHHLPDWILMSLVALTLVIELIVPFFIFLPRQFRFAAAFIFIIFQAAIILTGNYNFFNLLTIFLCIFLLDDNVIKKCMPGVLISKFVLSEGPRPAAVKSFLVLFLSAIVMFSSIEQIAVKLSNKRDYDFTLVSKFISPFMIVNTYGPFAVMTTVRNEIIIEGSNDNKNWKEYKFKYKPDELNRHPGYIIPHQPRLDWQMWFAALSPPEYHPWFRNFLLRLLLDSSSVTDLLEYNPFPGAPPASIRALLYEYQFTSFTERQESGNWWKRKLVSVYYPPVRINIKN